MKTNHIEATAHTTVSGIYQVRVMNKDGTPATPWSDPIKNLILPAGFDATWNWYAQIQKAHAGTGSTPNTSVPDGTFSQTGTTVTRVSGTGVFVSGNVNDFIKFSTGERAKIVSFTNSLTVEVDRSQTVAATGLTIYDTSRTGLDAWVKYTATKEANTTTNVRDDDAGTCTISTTLNFTTETSPITYTEVGVTPSSATNSSAVLFSRVVLPAPVYVNIDQFLQLKFTLICVVGNCRTATVFQPNITGWPYPYAIQSITSNGTYWDVVVDKACSSHYAVGRPITIEGAVPVRKTITSISSTGSDFTVNATGHGLSPGDSIEIEGTSPAGYNGTWTVATTPDANSLTVTSAINLGAGSGGTVRLTTPGTWYNGTHTIASFPNSTTIRITNATTIPTAGIAGTVTNSLQASVIITGPGFTTSISNSLNGGPLDFGNASQGGGSPAWYLVTETNIRTGLQYGVSTSPPSSINNTSYTQTAGTYDSANRRKTYSGTIPTATGNDQAIRQICVSYTSCQLYITFDERQRKDNDSILTLSYTKSWEPDLS